MVKKSVTGKRLRTQRGAKEYYWRHHKSKLNAFPGSFSGGLGFRTATDQCFGSV